MERPTYRIVEIDADEAVALATQARADGRPYRILIPDRAGLQEVLSRVWPKILRRWPPGTTSTEIERSHHVAAQVRSAIEGAAAEVEAEDQAYVADVRPEAQALLRSLYGTGILDDPAIGPKADALRVALSVGRA